MFGSDERFWGRVIADPSGCWTWLGYHNYQGYGIVGLSGRRRRVHRVTFELLIGSIPEGLEPDHLCRNRGCCNPTHIELVTHRENLLRGLSVVARCAQATHCPHGHEYTPENTRYRPTGERQCRTCLRARPKARYWKDPEAARAYSRRRYAEARA